MLVYVCDHAGRRYGCVHRSERHARLEIAAMIVGRKDLPAFPEIQALAKSLAVRKQFARTLAFVTDERGLRLYE